MANSKETLPPSDLCVDRSLWGLDDTNQNLLQPVQRQYNSGSSNSAQQENVLGNNRHSKTAPAPLVPGASYKPPPVDCLANLAGLAHLQ
ncbi:uncharacterized protein PG986_003810 [Apiospora aurea]|uniref:Uncharacterized protein n=1 Tax=Apiospora aurea TaxID=335848 RepID=A0ABR1QSP5_9PEZI